MPTTNNDDLATVRKPCRRPRPDGKTQIVVGMGTAGIAAGARETLKATSLILRKTRLDIILRQTANCSGWTGASHKDPPGAETVTYGKVTRRATRSWKSTSSGQYCPGFQIMPDAGIII